MNKNISMNSSFQYVKKFLNSDNAKLILIVIFGTILRILLSYDPIRINDGIAYYRIAHDIIELNYFDPLKYRSYGNRYFMVLFVLSHYVIVGTDEILIKLIHMIPSILGIVVTYYFSNDLTKNPQISRLVSLIHATVPLELVWSGSGSLDPFFGFFISTFFWFYYRAVNEERFEHVHFYSIFAGVISAFLISLRVLGIFVYIALAVHLVIRREQFKPRLRTHFVMIISGIITYIPELIFLTIKTGNPLYGILSRSGFDVGGASGIDVGSDPRLNDEIFSLSRYIELLFIPYWIGFLGIAFIISAIFFLKSDKWEQKEIIIFIFVMFFILQFFPLYLILDPITVLQEGKPWFFEKQIRFFTTFTSLFCVIIASFIKEMENESLPNVSSLKLDVDIELSNILKYLVVGMILFNLIVAATLYQPINQETNVREVTNYLEDNDIKEIYVDSKLMVSRYEVASNYEISVKFTNDTTVLNSLNCTIIVFDSSIRDLGVFQPEDIDKLVLVEEFYSNSKGITSFNTYEFTTQIYLINPNNCF